MQCDYFGKCGSCTLYNIKYDWQLYYKLQKEQLRFGEFYNKRFDLIKSDESHFRNRAEFRIYHKNGDITYAMNGFDKKPVCIKSCSIVSNDIAKLMPKLLDEVKKSEILMHKLFSVEFFGSLKGDMLVTLIYHKKLDDIWKEEALKLQEKLNTKIIGRARKQKIILSDDYINEELIICATLQEEGQKSRFKLKYYEGGFTQPNAKVNIGMIEWVLNTAKHEGDLCELYCGSGNFTIPLATKFDKILATEISKTSIRSAKENCKLNKIENIEFIRMSSEEFVQALRGDREFNRLKDTDLSKYSFGNIYKKFNAQDSRFNTIFVDPPRAGLDITTTNLVKRFDQIIYISCNPETLYRDLKELTQTHKIEHFVLFDQFAYTKHIECGVVLVRI